MHAGSSLSTSRSSSQQATEPQRPLCCLVGIAPGTWAGELSVWHCSLRPMPRQWDPCTAHSCCSPIILRCNLIAPPLQISVLGLQE